MKVKNVIEIFGIIIGILIGSYIEGTIIQMGDIIINTLSCEIESGYYQACMNNKNIYYIATKIIFPITGAVSAFVLIRKKMN